MCFTPYISLATALLEFIFATLILIYFRKSNVTRYVVALLYLLGTYQFTEMMLCFTGDANIWVRVGFLAYTYLPAVGMHFFLSMTGNKWKKQYSLIYLLPVAFSLYAIFSSGFVEEGVCNSIFITTKTIFNGTGSNKIASFLYGAYYYLFILSSVVFALYAHHNEKNRWKKVYYLICTAGLTLITLSPFVFIMLLPSYGISFPSVYCEFALLFAIVMFVASYLDNKYRIF